MGAQSFTTGGTGVGGLDMSRIANLINNEESDPVAAAGDVCADRAESHVRGDSAATEPTGGGRNSIRRSGREGGRRGSRESRGSRASMSSEEGEWGAGAAGASFVHVSIFPGTEFVFSGACQVLVMAEDKRKAQHHMAELQVRVVLVVCVVCGAKALWNEWSVWVACFPTECYILYIVLL